MDGTKYDDQDHKEVETVYAIQHRSEYEEKKGRAIPKIPGICWACGGVGHLSNECPAKKGPPEFLMVCSHCRREGHKALQCPELLQYEKLTLSPGMEWYIGKTIHDVEKETYKELLSEYQDMFAWLNTDLTGIAPEYGEQRIDLKEGSSPIRQTQYRLNPKYSLKVKEELDKLLEAGFIYPVKHSEWVSRSDSSQEGGSRWCCKDQGVLGFQETQ
jgi:hypothetical protein